MSTAVCKYQVAAVNYIASIFRPNVYASLWLPAAPPFFFTISVIPKSLPPLPLIPPPSHVPAYLSIMSAIYSIFSTSNFPSFFPSICSPHCWRLQWPWSAAKSCLKSNSLLMKFTHTLLHTHRHTYMVMCFRHGLEKWTPSHMSMWLQCVL